MTIEELKSLAEKAEHSEELRSLAVAVAEMCRHYAIDGTADEGFPLRILKAYRDGCNVRMPYEEESGVRWLFNSEQQIRADALDAAICVLEHHKKLMADLGPGRKLQPQYRETVS